MKTFVVRLNPDLREIQPYTKYATKDEYYSIESKGSMSGFEECANYLDEKGIIRGYLPPKHSKDIRSCERFNLIIITSKSAKEKANQIIGIQFNCIYVGENQRPNPNRKGTYLFWHYKCNTSDAIIFTKFIPDAREIILDNKRLSWYRHPTLPLNNIEADRVFNKIYKKVSEIDRKKIDAIKVNKLKNDINLENLEEDEMDLGYEDLTRLRTHKFFERDSSFIKKLKPYFIGKPCQACGCNLKDKYGSLGDGYMEVHHLIPVSNDKGSKIKRKLEDFTVLCPNCHRMIHRSEYISDLEKFRKYLENLKQ